jgi:mono/diheme cytochrome c family protein
MRRVLVSTLVLAAACSQDNGAPSGVGLQPSVPGAPSGPVAGAPDSGAQPGVSSAAPGGGTQVVPTVPGAGMTNVLPGDGGLVPVTGGPGLADAQVPLASNVITYQKHIRPLIVGNCVECHTKGGIGPSDLSDWTMVKPLAPLIVNVVGAGRMPPWPASDKCHEIAESRALPQETKDLFKQWEVGGYQEGNAADYVAPAPRHREDLGPATLTMKAKDSFTPGVNSDTYRCFYLGTVPEDTYVTALDLIPGNRAEVHHIQLHRVEPADAPTIANADASDPGGGYSCNQGLINSQNMFSYRPGALAVVLNQGDAVYFKGGSGLLLQIHYNTQFLPSGTTPGPDQSSVAMWTLPSGQHPERVVYRTGAMAPLNGDGATNPLAALTASIPANATNVVGQDTVSMGELGTIGTTFLKGEIVGMTPHAHSWATRMVASLKPSGGSEACLIDVPDWDFNWQLDYMFKTGVPYTQNDTVHIECDYDNTAANQPVINGMRTPVMPITFGEKTLNEMCLHYIWLRFAYADFAAANR